MQRKTLKLVQININGISRKLEELHLLATTHKLDIITVQESKLQQNHKTPTIADYSTHRTDRKHKQGGGLVTFIHKDITYTPIQIPQQINVRKTEIQTIRVHLTQKKQLYISNMYIPPRQTTDPDHSTEDEDINRAFSFLESLGPHIITGDINAHSSICFGQSEDHRGALITDILTNSTQIILNSNTPTRQPHADQEPTAPDISTASNTISNKISWKTLTELSSDHLPILITFNSRSLIRQQPARRSFTNYHKANWEGFTAEIEEALADVEPPQNVHQANAILSNLILSADKHNIPKGKIHSRHKLLPQEIRTVIQHRNDIRRNNPKDQEIPQLNQLIDRQIQEHKTQLWKEHLEDDWDHRHNTHKLWKTIGALSNKKPTSNPNTSISFGNKTATNDKEKAASFNKQFANTIKHETNPNNRVIDRQTRNLQSEQIDLTEQQIITAIKNSKTNNSTGPDDINIRHLKHLGPRAISYLTRTYNTALNSNTIPKIWKTAKIVPIPKPNKDLSIGTSYRPIALLSPLAKTLEKIILPYITENINLPDHQHGFRQHRSTTTALHQINNLITTGFNQNQPPQRTVAIALDMSKAFDTVHLHKLIQKLHRTRIPTTVIKYIANYIKGRTQYTLLNGTKSNSRNTKTGVPQGGVLSPTLFNIYMADLPAPPPNVHTLSYADDITVLSTHTSPAAAQSQVQQYLEDIHTWTEANQLSLNASKTTTTLFTPDPAQYSLTLNLSINGVTLPTVKNPKILGLTLDPKMNYSAHIQNTHKRASQTIGMLKALTSTHWGKTKETLATTYKTITRPIIEYANTIWSPVISATNIGALQTVQNSALRTITGCTRDTNAVHLHQETKILPIEMHLKLHASQLRQQAQHPDHTLHALTRQLPTPRLKKQTVFNNRNYTYNLDVNHENASAATVKENLRAIHDHHVTETISRQPNNKVLDQPAPPIHKSEEELEHSMRRTLAQLRTNKSPLLQSYLNKINPGVHPTSSCPLCGHDNHDTRHLFQCPVIPTSLVPDDLWRNPAGVERLVAEWRGALGRPPEEA